MKSHYHEARNFLGTDRRREIMTKHNCTFAITDIQTNQNYNKGTALERSSEQNILDCLRTALGTQVKLSLEFSCRNSQSTLPEQTVLILRTHKIWVFVRTDFLDIC